MSYLPLYSQGPEEYLASLVDSQCLSIAEIGYDFLNRSFRYQMNCVLCSSQKASQSIGINIFACTEYDERVENMT